MKRDELIAKLHECSDSADVETAHRDADRALLGYINDRGVLNAYQAIKKWYAWTLPAGFDDDVRWLLKTLVKQTGGESPYVDGLVDEAIDQIHRLLGVKAQAAPESTDHAGHNLWPLISDPGRTWCRDCQVHFYPRLPEEM